MIHIQPMPIIIHANLPAAKIYGDVHNGIHLLGNLLSHFGTQHRH